MTNSAMIRLRVGELLAEAGMTQKELADKSGLPRTNINRMVKHPSQIKMIGFSTLESLCAAFGVQTNKVIEYLPDSD